MEGIELFFEGDFGPGCEIFSGDYLGFVSPSGAVEWVGVFLVYFGERVLLAGGETDFDEGLGVGGFVAVEGLLEADF